MNPLRRWGPWVALVVVVAVALSVGLGANGAGPRDNIERLDHLTKQLDCQQCAGETVYESRTVFAENVRDDVRRQIAEGATDQQILDRAVIAYGESVLLVPTAEGLNLVLWIAPISVATLGLGFLGIAFSRWKTRSDDVPSDEDRAAVDAALEELLEQSP